MRIKDEVSQKTQNKYQTLFDSIDEGVSTLEIIFDQQGKANDYLILENNPAAEKFLGLGVEAGKTACEINPNTEDSWIQVIADVARTREPVRIELPFESLNIWLSAYLSPIGVAETNQVIWVYSDISDRKRTEANLEFFSEISSDLVSLAKIDETIALLGEKIGTYFNASAYVFTKNDETLQSFIADHEWHRVGVPSLKGMYRYEDFHTKAFRQESITGKPYVVCSASTDPRVNATNLAAINVEAYVNVLRPC